MSTGADIELLALTKTYGAHVAVDQVSLTVRAGEFMTLLGPSGSGKTTTLNMVAGFDQADAGDLRVDGSSIAAVPPADRNIGMVFQNYALFPHLSVEQNIGFPLKQRKVRGAARRRAVGEALETVRLTGFERRLPAELSGGQQQRVALARAIVFEPRVLLMDEPLGALDRTLRDSMQIEIKRIHREVGSTVLFVTHDQEEALALSDRIAVFNDGRIEQVGTGRELYERPDTLFVARFLGESSLLSGTVRARGAETVLQSDHGTWPCAQHRSLPDGAAGVLVVRPERARLIGASGSPPPGSASVAVTVLEDVYLGSGRKLSVALPDGSAGMVRESIDRLSDVAVGEQARMWWRPDDAVLVADDAGDRTPAAPETFPTAEVAAVASTAPDAHPSPEGEPR